MNKERLLGIFNNILLEVQEDKQIDYKGISKVMDCLAENIKDYDEQEHFKEWLDFERDKL